MCWDAIIDGKRVSSRDEIEEAIGTRACYRDDEPRMTGDHCLCPIDVPATLLAAGYAVRACWDGDKKAMAGDFIASRDPRALSDPA